MNDTKWFGMVLVVAFLAEAGVLWVALELLKKVMI